MRVCEKISCLPSLPSFSTCCQKFEGISRIALAAIAYIGYLVGLQNKEFYLSQWTKGYELLFPSAPNNLKPATPTLLTQEANKDKYSKAPKINSSSRPPISSKPFSTQPTPAPISTQIRSNSVQRATKNNNQIYQELLTELEQKIKDISFIIQQFLEADQQLKLLIGEKSGLPPHSGIKTVAKLHCDQADMVLHIHNNILSTATSQAASIDINKINDLQSKFIESFKALENLFALYWGKVEQIMVQHSSNEKLPEACKRVSEAIEKFNESLSSINPKKSKLFCRPGVIFTWQESSV